MWRASKERLNHDTSQKSDHPSPKPTGFHLQFDGNRSKSGQLKIHWNPPLSKKCETVYPVFPYFFFIFVATGFSHA